MFGATSHILKTLTRDPVTTRVRSIKPSEDVESMWDGLDKTARAWSWSPHSHDVLEGVQESYKYTEADEIEDALLFPDEATGEMANNLFRHYPSAMELFERDPFDARKFASDRDTDDDDDDDSEGFNYDDDEAIEDDGDSEWENESSDKEYKLVFPGEEEALDALTEHFKTTSLGLGEPDYFLPLLRNPSKSRFIPDVLKPHPFVIMENLRGALRSQKQYDHSPAGVEADFFRHIDREKSKGMWVGIA